VFHFNKISFIRLGRIAFIFAGCYASLAQADAILVYETADAADAKTQYTFSISGRFVRIDSEPREQPGYSLFDTGRMVMFNVDETAHSYTPVKAGRFFHPSITVTPPDTAEDKAAERVASPEKTADKTPEKVASSDPAEDSTAKRVASSDPATAASTEATAKTADSTAESTLKATKKKRTVAGKRCRVVLEIAGDKPVAEHCMSGTGELGLSKREVITLSRLFTKAANLDLNLLGAATKDERYVSIQSQRTDDKASQTLKSVSKTAIPSEKMRIPEDYKQLQPAASKAP